MNTQRPRICHIVPSLVHGGAERMLVELVRTTQHLYEHRVYVLKRLRGGLETSLRYYGIPVISVGLNRPWQVPRALRTLRHIFAVHDKPHLVQGWLYHGNVAASMTAPEGTPVAHGIHATDYQLRLHEFFLALAIRANSRLAQRASAVIYCTEGARAAHEAHGFPSAKGHVVRNGVDMLQFSPRPDHRNAERARLGIPGSAPVVGYLARYVPFKDVENFLQTLVEIRKTHPDLVALAMGIGLSEDNKALVARRTELGLGDTLRLLGPRNDVADIHAALDLVMLSSAHSEALPIAILEAMSSGLPVAVTAVGDLPTVLSGMIEPVPPRDAQALADLSCRLLALDENERSALSDALRMRIRSFYSLEKTAGQYSEIYRQILGR